MLLRTAGMLAIAFHCAAMSGCASVVAEYISRPQNHDFSNISTTSQLQEQGFVRHEFCPAREVRCMSYLTAPPLLSPKIMAYEVQIDTAKRLERIALRLDRADTPASFRGTVLLLHGFRASKEFMANTALYFRFLGFDVVMPDLLGHGATGGKVGFGIADSEMLSELLDDLPEKRSPLYVVGNSMGALAAVYLAHRRGDVRGLILQAPMPVLDLAARNYIESYSPMLSKFLTRRSIDAGVERALRDAGVTLQQTDIKPLVTSLQLPVLIFASPADPVSSFDDFLSLENRTVTLKKIPDRSHPAMSVVGQDEADVIKQWLSPRSVQ